MTKPVATHIRFEYPLQRDVIVPVAEAFEFADRERNAGIRWLPKKVYWEDGYNSWAKGWWSSSKGYLCRVGAGAYGDATILSREP